MVSRVLGITLTSREFGKAGRLPMAGFPAQSLEAHIGKLLSGGYALAICDQLEEPSAARGLVRRGVVRVLTSGTVFESSLLDPTRDNPLAALAGLGDRVGLALLEVSTGRIELAEFSRQELPQLPGLVSTAAPSELLVAEGAELWLGLPGGCRLAPSGSLAL